MSLTIAAADATAKEKAAADYVCDGVDDQVEINAAIQVLNPTATTAIKHGEMGGDVTLYGRLFNVSAPILMTTLVTVRGRGRHTTIKPTAAMNGGETSGVFQLASPDVQYTSVERLTIHGNGWTGGAQCCGIYYNQGAGVAWDAAHWFKDLYIYATYWHGLYLTHPATGATRDRAHWFSNVRVIDAGGTDNLKAVGAWLGSTDCTVIGLDVGSSNHTGIKVTGANNRIVASKGWFTAASAGEPASGRGIDLTGSARNVLVGCEGQDNRMEGIRVGGIHNQLIGYIADSNGYDKNDPTSVGKGVVITGGQVIAVGLAFDKNEQNRGVRQVTPIDSSAAVSTVIMYAE